MVTRAVPPKPIATLEGVREHILGAVEAQVARLGKRLDRWRQMSPDSVGTAKLADVVDAVRELRNLVDDAFFDIEHATFEEPANLAHFCEALRLDSGADVRDVLRALWRLAESHDALRTAAVAAVDEDSGMYCTPALRAAIAQAEIARPSKPGPHSPTTEAPPVAAPAGKAPSSTEER